MIHHSLRLLAGLTACLVLIVAGTARAAEPVRLRVLSYNIHHGEGTDGKIDLERIAAVIRAAEPDLVAVNEVDQGVERTNRMDQPAELARLTKLTVIFEQNIPYQGGKYGNAVLSRLPVKKHENHKLPSHYKGEQRGMLEVHVEVAGLAEPVVFLATHFDYRPNDTERRASADATRELVKKSPGAPMILAGDLNANPDSEVLKRLKTDWLDTAEKPIGTYPSEMPVKQIDYVLARPAARWRVVACQVIEEKLASDHRPILATLELLPRTE